MTTTDLSALNGQFGIDDHLSFKAGPGGLTVAEIGNVHATATVALLGAHVMEFQPRGQKPVLWMSASSMFEPGQPIRGGIPVCWPWFGGHPTDADKPNHGFVRTMIWNVLGAEAIADGATRLRLGLRDSDATLSLWPHAFELELAVTVGEELRVELVSRNPGEQAYTFTGALHTYFAVSAASDIYILGLDGCTYVDTVGGARRSMVQTGPVTISEETDRIYTDTAAECVIEDPGLNRSILIAKEGSGSTVVWNPWVAKSKLMPDFGDEEYPGMVCVETAKALEDAATVAPGGEHRLAATISTSPLRR